MADPRPYEIYAIKYGDHQRRASENFLGGDPPKLETRRAGSLADLHISFGGNVYLLRLSHVGREGDKRLGARILRGLVAAVFRR